MNLFESITPYFKKHNYGLITRNCNKFVKSMAETIGLNHLANIHDRVIPASSANYLSKNIVNNVDNTAFMDYKLGQTSTFITHNKLMDVSYNSDYNDFAIRSIRNGIKRYNKTYKYDFIGSKKIDKDNFKSNLANAARKDLSIIDKLMFKKYKVKGKTC